MNKDDAPRLIEEAKRNGLFFQIKTPWKVFYLIFGIICLVLIFTSPFAILMFILYAKPCVAIANEGIVIKWIGTRVISWRDFDEFKMGSTTVHGSTGAGLLVDVALKTTASVAIKGPLQYTLKELPEIWHNIAVHQHNDSLKIIQEIEKRSGKRILSQNEPA